MPDHLGPYRDHTSALPSRPTLKRRMPPHPTPPPTLLPEEVKDAIYECPKCLHNRLKPTADATLHPIPPSKLYAEWTMDLIGPLPYIFVAVGCYSKNIEARACQTRQLTSWYDS